MLLLECPLQTLSPTLISKGTCPLCSFARWPSPRWRRCWSKALGTSLGSMPRTMHRLGSPIPRPAAADLWEESSHQLCGSDFVPRTAGSILDFCHLQALLILYHSMPTDDNKDSLGLFAYPWREEDNQRKVISFCVGVSIPIVFCWVTTMSSAARSGCSASCRVPKWFLHLDSSRAAPDSRWTARLELRWRQSRKSTSRPLAFEIHAYTNNQRYKETLGGRILSDLHHLSCSKIASVCFFD